MPNEMDYSLKNRVIDGTGMILDTEPGTPDDIGTYVTENQLADWIKGKILFTGYYHNGNFYSDSGHTTLLAKVNGALYIDQTNANKALYVCLSSTYQSLTEEAQVQAILDGLDDGTIVPLKAKQDQNGNVIDQTYETKADASDLKDAIAQHEARIENLEEAHGSYHEVDVKSVYTIPTGKGSNWIVDGLRGVQRAKNQIIEEMNATNFTFNNSTGSFSDGVCTFTASAYRGSLIMSRRTLPSEAGHTILISVKIKTTTATTNVRLYAYGGNATLSCEATTNWQTLSRLITTNASWGYDLTGNNKALIEDTRNSDWDAIQVKDFIATDLTVYFNGTIPSDADTIAKIQTNYPWLLTPSDYGTSVVNTVYEGVRSKARNLWDEVYEEGDINYNTGIPQGNSNYIRSVNFCEVKANTSIYVKGNNTIWLLWYDANYGYLGGTNQDGTAGGTVVTSPANARYFKLVNRKIVFDGKICINVSDSQNGTYTPYWTPVTLTFPSPVSLKSAGAVAEEAYLNEDGEAWKTNPLRSYTFTGSESWNTYENCKYTTVIASSVKWSSSAYSVGNISCPSLVATSVNDLRLNGATVSGIAIGVDGAIAIGAIDYANISALTGKTIYYELATPDDPTPITVLTNNLIQTEGGGTLEATKTYPIDDSFTVGYLTL